MEWSGHLSQRCRMYYVCRFDMPSHSAAGNSMYFMRLLQWGLGTLRYFRSLAQPAINVIGKPPSSVLLCLLHIPLTVTAELQQRLQCQGHNALANVQARRLRP